MHRAKDLDGNEVKGYWFKLKTGKHYILLEDSHLVDVHIVGRLFNALIGFVEIDPATLAMDTTVKEKYDKPIYGTC